MIIAQNSASITTYYKGTKLLFSVYKGKANLKLGRQHLEELMVFYTNNEVSLAIIDLSKVYGSFAKLFEFINDIYYPHIYKNGLRKHAYIIPKDLILANLGERLKQTAAKINLETEVFSSKEEALTWAKKWLKVKKLR